MSTSSVTYNGETITAITVDTFTLTLNQDPDMKVSEVRAGAEEIELLERRVLGQAEGLESDFDSASTEFTDIIKWDIDAESTNQFGLWMDVCSSLRFCAGLTEEWADALSEYKQERRRLINRWNDEAGALEGDLGKGSPLGLPFLETGDEKAKEALRSLKEEIEGDESRAHITLNNKATEIRQDLAAGPTPEAVQRLIDSGHFSWAYFNLSGDVETLPIDMDGGEAAEEVLTFAEDPSGYEGDIAPIMAILSNMAYASTDKRNNGEQFSAEEMAFLEEFYSTLENEAPEEPGGNNGVLSVVDRINFDGDIDDETKAQVLGGLGDGLLVLSDEEVGGGYERLPENVQEAVTGVSPEQPGYLPWTHKAYSLAEMFEHSNPTARGGEEFSVNLTHTMGHLLDDVSSLEEYSMAPEHVQTLVDVSTRNEDANLEILTNDNVREGESNYGQDNEKTLRGLYTYDWKDDGEALSGLTDWIWEQADGTEEEQERSAEGLLGLVTTFSENSETFLDTGHEVGNNPNAAITELNPEVSESLTKTFSTYVDHFAASAGDETNKVSELDAGSASHIPLFEEGDLLVSMSHEARGDFIQLLVAEETTEPYVMLSSIDHEHRTMNEAIFDGDLAPEDYGSDSGRLQGMIDNAIISEFESRQTEADEAGDRAQQEAAAKWNTAYSIGKDLLGGGASAVPVAGPVLSTGVNLADSMFGDDVQEFIDEKAEEEVARYREQLDNGEDLIGSDNSREDQTMWNAELQLAHMLMREGDLSPEAFEEAELLVDGNLPMNQGEWDSGHSSRTNEVREIVEEHLVNETGDEDIGEILDEYMAAYARSFEPQEVN